MQPGQSNNLTTLAASPLLAFGMCTQAVSLEPPSESAFVPLERFTRALNELGVSAPHIRGILGVAAALLHLSAAVRARHSTMSAVAAAAALAGDAGTAGGVPTATPTEQWGAMAPGLAAASSALGLPEPQALETTLRKHAAQAVRRHSVAPRSRSRSRSRSPSRAGPALVRSDSGASSGAASTRRSRRDTAGAMSAEDHAEVAIRHLATTLLDRLTQLVVAKANAKLGGAIGDSVLKAAGFDKDVGWIASPQASQSMIHIIDTMQAMPQVQTVQAIAIPCLIVPITHTHTHTPSCISLPHRLARMSGIAAWLPFGRSQSTMLTMCCSMPSPRLRSRWVPTGRGLPAAPPRRAT